MRILYVCGTYAPGAFAGSELSAHELLRDLQRNGSATVRVATDTRYTGGGPGRAEYDGVPVVGIRHDDRHAGLRSILADFRPDVIFTQLMWSDAAVAAGRDAGIPSVLRIPSTAPNLDLETPTRLVANSRFICDWVRRASGRECRFIFSTIDLERVVAEPATRAPRYITMFNPVRDKGGHIFRRVTRALPDRKFAVVPGWHSLRNSDGSWDRQVIAHSLDSQRAPDRDWLPKDVDFSRRPNVTILPPRDAVAEIFASTRILLVPSQYEDTLARVSIEAFANGIPVIGSNVGGLKDHLRTGGIVVEDYRNADAWVTAIRSLDDPAVYASTAHRALRYIAEEFSNDRTAAAYLDLFREAADDDGRARDATQGSGRDQ